MDNIKTGKFIAELRKEKGLTQQQLGDLLNLSNKTISKWESGGGSPDLSNLPLLANALGVTADELLRGERMPREPQGQSLTPAQKKERAILAAGACLGAILGILAYNYGWLG